MAKLFIVGFPKDFQQIALVELFSIHGTVNTVTLVTDKVTGQPKGYGFITMNDDAGAKRAIAALNGTSMGGRTISVRFAEEKPPARQTSERPAFHKRDNRTAAPKFKRPRRD
ncbi:MAG: RNA-binding protein [Bacteroidota bacterium]